VVYWLERPICVNFPLPLRRDAASERQGSMSARSDTRKDDLIDRIVALSRSRLGAKAGPAETFLRAYYANVSAEDLAGSSVEDLYGAAIALWQFGRTRKLGQAKVRVYTPRLAEHGWASTHSVVEIVNDDMPFLVDSVTAELNRRELTVHIVIHPIVRVTRDAKGGVKEIAGKDAKDALAESYMHVEIDQQGSAELLTEIERSIETVLADVRASVADWRAMMGRADAVMKELTDHPPPVPQAETTTARDFLGWLIADHFTFLGYREYEFVGEGEAARTNVVAGSGLGLARDESFVIFEGLRNLAALPPDVRDFVRQPRLLMITKANRRSTVHRPVHLDTIGIKRFNAKGKVTGQYVFIGLFTSTAYSQTPREIPLLSEKVGRIIDRAGFPPNSHDAKALQHILDTFSRNELFQASEEELYEMALGVLRLQDRQRIALFVRKDSFERFVSCFVYVPRDRYTTELRLRFQKILEQSFNGSTAAFASHFGEETALVRVHIVIRTVPGKIPAYSIPEIVARLTETARTFADRLRDALIHGEGEERGMAAWRRYAEAFPVGYRDRFGPEAAVDDIAKAESVLGDQTQLALNLYRDVDAPEEELRFRVFHKTTPLPLSDVLPMLEALGLRVISESAYAIAPSGSAAKIWMHDFALTMPAGQSVDLGKIKPLFEDAFAGIWSGAIESDGFNRLVIAAQLDAREVSVLRAYAKYLRQAAIPFSQPYMESAVGRYPQIARRIVDLFKVLHDPAKQADAEVKSRGLLVELEHLFDSVTSLDDDRILRRFLNLVRVTLRTNYFQRVDGKPKPWISFKLDSHKVEDLPLPRPLVEVFVYSPRVEAIHLRGGKVARGGIRWSDRREDFRTEILGLMKAQMVKNAVIVPVGSKGGFFVKHPPAPEAGREAAQAEGIECYKTLMRGLLDITDNLTVDGVKPPAEVVRHDGDDPYLVVAADKGTATFSDIANGVARDYGFWLDDAFASGGSSGYDHKGMGITARGAWVAVQRHFRELGIDVQAQEHTVVGVGDMSGDVFGNGMLRSRKSKLLVAFDHRHIFVDPTPDPEKSFAERERLFKLPRSSWADYDKSLISKGGGVFERSLKSIKLTAEIKTLLGVAADTLTPAELIKAALKAPVDLLWLGGIGTYVKASDETNAEVGDRANDALRVDGRELRARVVGEGANLGVTQRGRIEYAQGGGRINTDAIDNSAGVDTSDHEVNIKVLLGDVVARGDMTIKQRDKLLVKMTDEVGHQVLRDNYLQTEALSVTEAEGGAALDPHVRLIRALEKTGRLNRAIEYLPDDEEIQRRQAAGQGLTRPELAVLLAYAKLTLYDQLLPSDLPDEPAVVDDLLRYFPEPIREQHRDSVMRHRLRREIVATVVTNSIVNRTGATFVNDMAERSGAAPSAIARAYYVVRAVFALRTTWEAIEQLDNKVPAATQYRMLRATQRLMERAMLWFLRHGAAGIDVAAEIERYAAGLAELETAFEAALEPARAAELTAAVRELTREGVPETLAQRIVRFGDLASGLDVVRIASRAKAPIAGVARLYFGIGARLGLDWLRAAAARVKAETGWQKLAVAATVEDLLALQAELTSRAIRAAGKLENVEKLAEGWLQQHKAGLARFDAVLAEMKASPTPEIAALTVAGRELRALTGA
jgi:glutamate dehydrogenase